MSPLAPVFTGASVHPFPTPRASQLDGMSKRAWTIHTAAEMGDAVVWTGLVQRWLEGYGSSPCWGPLAWVSCMGFLDRRVSLRRMKDATGGEAMPWAMLRGPQSLASPPFRCTHRRSPATRA